MMQLPYGRNNCLDPILTLQAPPEREEALRSLPRDDAGFLGHHSHHHPASIASLCWIGKKGGAIIGQGNTMARFQQNEYKYINQEEERDEKMDVDEEEVGSPRASSILSKLCTSKSVGTTAQLRRNFHDDYEVDDENRSSLSSSLYYNSPSSSSLLEGRILITGSNGGASNSSGECCLWDLEQQRIVQRFSPIDTGGPALSVQRRIDNNDNGCGSQIIYQTRDPKGTVWLYDLDHFETSHSSASAGSTTTTFQSRPTMISSIRTYSRTFCTVCPCKGDSNWIACPSKDETCVTVRDWRIRSLFSSKSHSVQQNSLEEDPSVIMVLRNSSKFRPGMIHEDLARPHGMVSSIAFACCGNAPNTSPLLACGMESGTVFFHDLRRIGEPIVSWSLQQQQQQQNNFIPSTGSIELGKEPILTMDMALSTGMASSHNKSSTSGHEISGESFVAIAGMAGNAADLLELSPSQRGTVAVIKVNSSINGQITSRIRSRLATCSIGKDQSSAKPGVALCRFRPDGRLFAIGGWDRRIRIFDRASKKTNTAAASTTNPLLAILHGHSASVHALDWAHDASSSGLLASGASDGRIHIWKIFNGSK